MTGTPSNISDRINALEVFVSRYPLSNTFRQFWKDYEASDPELVVYLRDTKNDDLPDGVLNAYVALADTLDGRGMFYSRDNLNRRIEEGPSFGDYRDVTLEVRWRELTGGGGHVMNPSVRAKFEAIKAETRSAEWIGKTHRERLTWLFNELQELISLTPISTTRPRPMLTSGAKLMIMRLMRPPLDSIIQA